MVAQVESLAAFGPGYHVGRTETYEQAQWWAWYNNIFDTLLPAPSINNGLALFERGDLIKLPLFEQASNFMSSAVLSELPTGTADTEAGTAWLTDNDLLLDRTLRRGTQYWSVFDTGIWTAEPGLITAINPLYYYRVGTPEQPDVLAGHIIAQPYRQLDETERLNPMATRVPNRIRVLRHYQGQSTVQVLHYSGETVGEPITPEEASPITAVCVAGEARSWYGGIKDTAARILIELTNLDQDFNLFRNRIQYIPSSADAATRGELERNNRPTNARAVRDEIMKQVRPLIALDAEDVPPAGSNEELETSGLFEELRFLFDLYYIASGLPPSSFGIGIGRGESGIARETAQTGATSRASAYRRDLQRCLPELAVAAGMPGKAMFNWTTPPFMTRSQRQADIIQLLNARIITPEQAANALGWEYQAQPTPTVEA